MKAKQRVVIGADVFRSWPAMIQNPAFNICGVCRANLMSFVPKLSSLHLSRQSHRLRTLGLIKRVPRSYRYYLTRLGRSAIAAAYSLTQFHNIPAMAHAT